MCSERDCRIFRGQIMACDRCVKNGHNEADWRLRRPEADN